MNEFKEEQKESETGLQFYVRRLFTDKLSLIDETTMKYAAGRMWGIRWAFFGPYLKDNDVVTVKITTTNVSNLLNHAFGFATRNFGAFKMWFQDGIYGNCAYINASGKSIYGGASASFSHANKINETVKLSLIDGKKLVVWMTVNMNSKEGTIWDYEMQNGVTFNLPDEVRIIVGVGGNDEKIITASDASMN